MAESPSCDLAIVGAGVSGCAVAAQLRRLGWGGSIQLVEIGRGPGGRCATRRSRHDADLAINHGAPLFNISGEPPALLEPLERGSWILPFAGAIQWLDDDGRCVDAGPNTVGIDDPGLLRGALWQGRAIRWQGAHVQFRNEGNIGILVMGNFDLQTPTVAQLVTLKRVLRELRATYGIKRGRVYTHKEWPGAQTACPGRTLQPKVGEIRKSIGA